MTITVTMTMTIPDNPPRPGLPHLPPEIWTQIIATITDSRYLPRAWLNFRRVSRFFKDATEHVFASLHLPRSRLEFLPFDPVTDRDRTPRDLDFALDFVRLSPDGTRAIYADKDLAGDRALDRTLFLLREPDDDDPNLDPDPDPSPPSIHDERLRQWSAKVTAYTAPPPFNRRDAPPHVLVLRRIADDTDLPDLQIDYAASQASFLWQPALSRLFGEEEYRKWAACQQPPHRDWQAIINRINDGRMNRLTLSRAVVARLDSRTRVAAKVRQTRVKRYFRRHGRELPSGAFADRDYVRKAKEVYGLREDLQRAFIGDEWKMGGRDLDSEEGYGTFYDDGGGVEYPESDPEFELDELSVNACLTS